MSENNIGQKSSDVQEQSIGDQEKKFLTFALGDVDYGIEILAVREIIGMMEVTVVPQVPEYVKGVINLRGKVIPVIDLRLKFEMESIEATEQTCIVVVNIEETLIGIIIDRVNEVLDIDQKNIEDAPSFGGTTINSEYILGMGKVGDSLKVLLNITKIVGDDLSVVSTSISEE